MSQRQIIDVHCHCFAGMGQDAQVCAGLERLKAAGVGTLAVMGLVNRVLDVNDVWRLVPEGFDYLGDPLYDETAALLHFNRASGGMLFPMVDTRVMVGDVRSQLTHYLANGYRGIKGLYLADDGNDLRVAAIPEVFGITVEQYHRREREIFAFAEAQGLPVVYHMDARRYGDVLCGLLDDFPRLRIDIPHFGIGRKAFAAILDRYPNVYTDIAYMAPHIRSNPDSYIDFIRHYPDRVCFGSDALLYQPEVVLEYIELVRGLGLPEELEEAVFSGNPKRFLFSSEF